MSQRRQTTPRRRMPLWVACVLFALGAIAIVANAAWLLRRPRLAPMPAINVEGLEPEVATIIKTARGNVQANERSAQAWGDLGAVLRAHDLGPEANVCFRNAELLDPHDYRWPYLLGVSLATTDADAALACIRRAANLAGDRPHVHLRLAEVLMSRGLNAEAAPIVDRVLAAAPREPRAQLAKARLLFQQGKFAESRSWAEKSAAGAADKRATHLLLAQTCRRLGDQAGQDRAQAALADIPDGVTDWDDPDVASVMALRRDRKWQMLSAEQMAASGDIAQAAGVLSELAQDDDPSASATLKLVQSYVRERNYARAEQLLREQLARHDDNEKLHFQLGVACFLQERFQPAIEEFRRVIALKPDYVEAHYNLGHALRKADDHAGAIDAFAAAIRLSPSHAFARINLAELLLEANQPEAARQHLDVAAKLAPGDPKLRELLARLPKGAKQVAP